jgi:predicted metal-dependent phosphotriesterase family hydrolase
MTATVMTVRGPVAADQLGFTLIHEHLLLDLMRDAWIGNHILNDPDLATLELQRYKDAGGVTLVDQTNRADRGPGHPRLWLVPRNLLRGLSRPLEDRPGR